MRALANLALVPLATLAGFAAATADSQEAAEVAVVEDVTVVEDGRRVSIEYTLTIDDGTVVETRAGEDAVEYEHGKGPLIGALQDALVGLAPGDSKNVTLAPEQAFGPVNPELFDAVHAEQLPEGSHVVGTTLLFTSADGQKFPVRVHELKGDEIVIDANHPLAGKTLHFDVRIISVE